MRIAVNGIEMHYDVQGEGEPLLFLHGLFGCRHDWRHISPDLGEGYRLIAPDLRGHGESTDSDGTFAHRLVARDVLALLDRLGISRAKAIGVSLGATTLLHMAAERLHLLDAMVVVSPTTHYPEQARAIMLNMPEPSDGERDLLRRRHARGDDQIRELWSYPRLLAGADGGVHLTPDDLARIETRTLIVYGDRDPLYPVDIAARMHTAMPHSSLWVMPDAGHGPVFLDQGPPFARAAREFLGTP